VTALDPSLEMPWLADTRAALLRAHGAGRLAGGLLLHGAAGVGADWLARWIAARLFCRTVAAGQAPCLRCIDCRRCFEGAHPDLHIVELLESGREGRLAKEIKVDQVRELAAELALTSHGGFSKVAIFTPADRMNVNAANALLKTLEEPTPGALLVLIAAEPARLPATVRSRCTRLGIRTPPREAALAWLVARGVGVDVAGAVLAASAGQPLAALEAAAGSTARIAAEVAAALERFAGGEGEDPAVLGESWSDDAYGLRLRAIENWLTDRARRWAEAAGGSSELRRAAHLQAGRPALNIRRTFELLDAVRDARALEETPVNRPVTLERILRLLAAAGGRAAA
jgi:DNA polymerase-3 subunit delta'